MKDSATATMHPERDEFTYQPISKLAIGALVLGVLSVAAYANPVLWLVPMVAIVVGLLACRSIARGESVGKGAAVSGLVFASFFGAFAITHHESRVSQLKQSTREFAQNWLKLVDDREFDKAFQFFQGVEGETKPPSLTYEQYYDENPMIADQRNMMLADTPIKELMEFDGELVLDKSFVEQSSEQSAYVVHRFRFVYEDQSQQVELPVYIQLIGKMNDTQDAVQWLVGAVKSKP